MTPDQPQTSDKPKRRRRRRAKHAAQPNAAAPSNAAAQENATAQPKPAAQAKPAAQPKPAALAKPAVEPKAAAQPRTAAQAKPATQPKPAAQAKPAAQPKSAAREPNGFGRLDLSPTMLAALDLAEYMEPTPIQAGLIPRALAGVDVMGQAQTGTGKTAAFVIPVLEQLKPRSELPSPQALILVPTRELAVQVRDEGVKLSAGRTARMVALYGGKPIRQQVEHLRRGAEVVVGTPGRVLDLMSRGALVLGDIRFVVLDEADRMLDIGFRPDIEKILRRCPQSRQTLLLSATIPPPVKRLAERYMRTPEALDFSSKDLSVDTIEQWYFTVDPERKYDLLVKLLERENPQQAIIFCRTKRGTDKVCHRLKEVLRGVDTIHGDLQQSARDRVMRQFREGKTKLLVATDVVGRGIDVSSVSHIINYDIPQFCDDYVHRVGRTGRMGREGVAFTFVSPEEGNELTRIEMRINRLLKRDEIAGFVALAKPLPTEELEADDGDELPELAAPKAVFGRRTHRIRRAL